MGKFRNIRPAWRMALAGAAVVAVGTGIVVATTTGSTTTQNAQAPAVGSTAATPTSSLPGQPAASGPRNASSPPEPASQGKPNRDDAVKNAREALAANGNAIRAGKGEEYQTRGVLVDRDGTRHVRFDRTYQGIAVLGGDFVVHSSPDGGFRSATVAQTAPITVSTKPGVRAEAAKSTAESRFQGTRQRTAEPKLVVDAGEGAPRLAWQVLVEGRTPKGRPSQLNVIIDATTGAVRGVFDDIHADEGTGRGLHSGAVSLSTTRRADGQFELADPARGDSQTRYAPNLNPEHKDPTRETTEPFVDSDNAWGNGQHSDNAAVAVDLHYGTQKTWDYFKNVHGRNGIRDDGKGATAYLHRDYDYGAYWSDRCFCFAVGHLDIGGSPHTGQDTVGHEMAHGVTRATANLTYRGESGGLNEATSDIFGTLVEFYAANPTDPADYLVGEKWSVPDTGKPLRYLDEPKKDGRSASCWNRDVKDLDVHYSSGVANKFFFNLAVGSGKSAWGESTPCDGAPAVTGIGNDKAGQIWYRALTTYMVSNTNFSGARQATLSAATDLFGADSAERATVDAAWRAVGVNGSDPIPPKPTTPAPPQGPVITDFTPPTGTVGMAVSLQVKATDAQGDPVTFTAKDLPPGLSINASTGLITGTPTTPGDFFLTVTASDPAGHTGTEYALWKIVAYSQSPTLDIPYPRTSLVGKPVSLQATATDPQGDPVTFTAKGLPPGLSINASTGLISGTPTTPGTYFFTVTASDPSGHSTTVERGWQLDVDPAEVPLVKLPASAKSTAGKPMSAQVVAIDPQGDPVTFTAKDLPPGLSINASTGLISGTPTIADAFYMSVTATDPAGHVGTTYRYWTVEPDPARSPTLSLPYKVESKRGEPTTFQVEATDPQGGPLTFTAEELPPGLSINASSGLVSGTPTTEGIAFTRVKVADTEGYTTAGQLLWFVDKATPAPTTTLPTTTAPATTTVPSSKPPATTTVSATTVSSSTVSRSRPAATTTLVSSTTGNGSTPPSSGGGQLDPSPPGDEAVAPDTTPVAERSLATTGTDVLPVVLAGLSLLALGSFLVLVRRRRNSLK